MSISVTESVADIRGLNDATPAPTISVPDDTTAALVAMPEVGLSATQSITEVDVNFNNTAGNYHIFVPNITAAIASKNLYAFATTTLNADATAGRFTVELEYSVF